MTLNLTPASYATPYHRGPNAEALTLKIPNAGMLAARFYSADQPMIRSARKLVRDQGEFTKELTQFFAPVDTTFMQQHVRLWFTADGLSFSVGWDQSDFLAAGLEFYPPFQEWGTSKMHANPSLFPAYRESEQSFGPAVSMWYRRALERSLRGQS